MSTKPESENPKGKNITILVTPALRERVDKLRETHFSVMQINQFTAYLVEVGLAEEEIRIKEMEARNEARLKRAAILDNLEPPLQVSEPAPSYGTEIKVVRPREFDNNVAAISDSAVYIPFYGQAAAGKPIDISISPGLVLPWSKELIKGDASRYFSVWIKGNSMTEAGIQDGDYVLLRRADAPRHNKIMLIRHGNESTLKWIKMKGDQEVYMCWEDGSGKEPVRLDDQDYEIQGEYMGFMRG